MFDNSNSNSSEFKGFGDSPPEIRTYIPSSKPKKARHPLDHDVVRPEIYRERIETRFDSPARHKLMKERVKALGFTDNDVRRFQSKHRVEAFACLGSDLPIRVFDLLFLNEAELRSLYYEASEARKLQSDYLKNFQERLEQSTLSVEKDHIVKQINTTQTVLGLYCTFENVARDLLKCPQEARHTFLKELRVKADSSDKIEETSAVKAKLEAVSSENNRLQATLNSFIQKNGDLEHDNQEYLTQIAELQNELKWHRDRQAFRRQFELEECPSLYSGMNIDSVNGSNLDDWLADVTDICKETPGVSVHSAGACGTMVLHFLKSKQAEDSLFWGTNGDHEDPLVNGHFKQHEVVEYIVNRCKSDDCAWQLAKHDLEICPSAKTSYLSVRVSSAICSLVDAGVLRRNCLGGHTLWATKLIEEA